MHDFSSAFDTIYHTILVHRLNTDIGFTDAVQQWFSSYLTDRTRNISLSNHCSAFAPVHSGVPQGSVHGPMLFTMYIKPLSAIIDSHSIIHQSFADDIQLHMSAPPYRISELLHSMPGVLNLWGIPHLWRMASCQVGNRLLDESQRYFPDNNPTIEFTWDPYNFRVGNFPEEAEDIEEQFLDLVHDSASKAVFAEKSLNAFWFVSSRCCGRARTTGCISFHVPVRVCFFEHGSDQNEIAKPPD